MKSLKYACGQNNSVFSRFSPDGHINWPIDFMYVSDPVFAEFLSEAVEVKLYDYKSVVVGAKHLIFLKLHALKNFIEHRHSKDLLDVIEIIRKNPNAITDAELQNACIKYANIDLYNRIKESMN
jgi:hypothetical protein